MRIRGKKKSKLSKGILEMKFMKKSKEKVDHERYEKEGREIFNHDLKEINQEGQEFILERSLIPIDGLLSGRMSFKGMNPEVERLMELEKQHVLERKKEEDRVRSNQPDIADEEMAHYLGKKNRNSNALKRSNELSNKSSDSESSSEEEVEPPKKSKFKRPVDSD